MTALYSTGRIFPGGGPNSSIASAVLVLDSGLTRLGHTRKPYLRACMADTRQVCHSSASYLQPDLRLRESKCSRRRDSWCAIMQDPGSSWQNYYQCCKLVYVALYLIVASHRFLLQHTLPSLQLDTACCRQCQACACCRSGGV